MEIGSDGEKIVSGPRQNSDIGPESGTGDRSFLGHAGREGRSCLPEKPAWEAWRTALPRKGVAERQTGNLLSISIEHDEHGL